jgi:hypothetical protein
MLPTLLAEVGNLIPYVFNNQLIGELKMQYLVYN